MSESSSSSFASNHRDGVSGYDGQGSPVPYRTGPLAYTPAVLCQCKASLKACRWISWSEPQPGRRYYRCQRAKNRKEDCSFFRWMDDEVSDWYKQLLRDLRDRVWGLKKDLAKEEQKVQAKELQILEMQRLLEDKVREVEEKDVELKRAQHDLSEKVKELSVVQNQLGAKDVAVQALELKEIPVEFFLRISNGDPGIIYLIGDLNTAYPVSVQQVNGRCLTSIGWPRFVRDERVSRMDTALFVAVGSNLIGVRLYGPAGVERPFASRPPLGHPMLNDFPPPVNAIPPQLPLPQHLRDMLYELVGGLQMTGQLLQTLSDVWLNQRFHFPMYAFRVVESHVGQGGQFYFGKKYSRYLGHNVPTTLMVDDVLQFGHEAVLARMNEGNGYARINNGWTAFSAWAGFEVGEVYVLVIREEVNGTYVMTFTLSHGSDEDGQQ